MVTFKDVTDDAKLPDAKPSDAFMWSVFFTFTKYKWITATMSTTTFSACEWRYKLYLIWYKTLLKVSSPEFYI
jgi:hypothetical protein